MINGLRLGWTEKENVPWPELSAAWGQTALLTQCLAKKLNIENFENFKLVPLGEKSFLEDKSGNRLPLYTSQNVRTKFFGDRQFDAAMVAYMARFSIVTYKLTKIGISRIEINSRLFQK